MVNPCGVQASFHTNIKHTKDLVSFFKQSIEIFDIVGICNIYFLFRGHILEEYFLVEKCHVHFVVVFFK